MIIADAKFYANTSVLPKYCLYWLYLSIDKHSNHDALYCNQSNLNQFTAVAWPSSFSRKDFCRIHSQKNSQSEGSRSALAARMLLGKGDR